MSDGWSALVQLARRMQEPRPVAYRRGDLESVAQLFTRHREPTVVLLRGRQVGHQGEVVARLDGGEEPVEIGRARRGRGWFLAREHLLGVPLALGHVRLIEGVDAENRPGDGGGELPAKEFLTQIVSI